MKINKKKFIYLISPNKVKDNFYKNLKQVLRSGKVSCFQLRLKKYSLKKKITIGEKIKKICKKYKVKFLINDDPFLSKKLNADGCHLGQKDIDFLTAKKILNNKIIGITCHNSQKLAKISQNCGADYIAFGSFYKTKTKKVKYYADLKILKWAKKNLNILIVAIGGINNNNYKILLESGADMIAISSVIWKEKRPSEKINLF